MEGLSRSDWPTDVFPGDRAVNRRSRAQPTVCSSRLWTAGPRLLVMSVSWPGSKPAHSISPWFLIQVPALSLDPASSIVDCEPEI